MSHFKPHPICFCVLYNSNYNNNNNDDDNNNNNNNSNNNKIIILIVKSYKAPAYIGLMRLNT